VGDDDDKSSNINPVKKNGAVIYNDIQVNAKDVELKKAWLVFEDGERVPEGNFVDFPVVVKLILQVDEGWIPENGLVSLGISERILDEDDNILLDRKDLFADNTEGFSVEDSKIIGITARIKRNGVNAPTSFKVHFKVWDKNGKGSIDGNYSIFSK
jgi:hypothetical protein